MSLKCLNTQPPQTYSRLFRPWDGKTPQDNTITSTTTTTTQAATCSIQNQTELNLNPKNSLVNIKNEDSVMCSIETRCANNSNTVLNNDLKGKPTATVILPQQIPDLTVPIAPLPPSHQAVIQAPSQCTEYFPTVPLYPGQNYNDFIMSNLPNIPIIGVDPFTMEQEYARILAEEAQVKMMSARKQRPKKFKCPHCSVAFSNNGQLRGHIRIHTGTANSA